MRHKLENKLALIIGNVNSGIGLAIAHLFASNGADLALVDASNAGLNNVDQLREKHLDRKISNDLFSVTESSNLSDVEHLFDEIKQCHSNYQFPQILVISSDVVRPKNLLETTEKEFDEIIDFNLKVTFLVTQVFLKLLRLNYAFTNLSSPIESYASIIMLVPLVGKFGDRFASHYGLARTQIETFAKGITKENGHMQIRCNVVWPSMIDSGSSSSTGGGGAGFHASSSALKRIGKPDEVAQLVYFLASDASSYITGACIDIDSGL